MSHDSGSWYATGLQVRGRGEGNGCGHMWREGDGCGHMWREGGWVWPYVGGRGMGVAICGREGEMGIREAEERLVWMSKGGRS